MLISWFCQWSYNGVKLWIPNVILLNVAGNPDTFEKPALSFQADIAELIPVVWIYWVFVQNSKSRDLTDTLSEKASLFDFLHWWLIRTCNISPTRCFCCHSLGSWLPDMLTYVHKWRMPRQTFGNWCLGVWGLHSLHMGPLVISYSALGRFLLPGRWRYGSAVLYNFL